MGSLSLLQNAKKNKATTAVVIVVVAFVVYYLIDQIQDVRHAATSYDYCRNVCDLFEFVGKIICWTIYALMAYFTYIQKLYSKWSIRLFYLVALVYLIYYIWAGQLLDYFFNHIGAEHMDSLPSLARGLYGAPVYFIIFSIFFLPKYMKDVIKLKEEQEMTI
jgi:hypothetical protein